MKRAVQQVRHLHMEMGNRVHMGSYLNLHYGTVSRYLSHALVKFYLYHSE